MIIKNINISWCWYVRYKCQFMYIFCSSQVHRPLNTDQSHNPLQHSMHGPPNSQPLHHNAPPHPCRPPPTQQSSVPGSHMHPEMTFNPSPANLEGQSSADAREASLDVSSDWLVTLLIIWFSLIIIQIFHSCSCCQIWWIQMIFCPTWILRTFPAAATTICCRSLRITETVKPSTSSSSILDKHKCTYRRFLFLYRFQNQREQTRPQRLCYK